ncbi:MAG: alpha-L-fucosidase [Clostridiales bacterium]|nr:alpha-L-fucosidase [Clostridiales bacterium]
MSTHEERVKWFLNDRFGMFIHWGLYAIPARGEWVRSREKMTIEDYEPFFEEFDPIYYDPKKWARAAKEAGMKYAVMTSKHHDGFCLFDSKLTDYKATNTPAGRDLIKEYVDAFRSEGLKVGFYYSIIDWHHPDYPAYGDRQHPMRDNEDIKDAEKDKDFSRYLEYMHGQVKELVTNYGQIDIMWFDFSYDDMEGEKWEATKLVEMVRSIQPNILIDNRLTLHDKFDLSIPYSGDFASPEQIIPPEGVRDINGNPVPWEACITMNNNWGYASADKDFKSAKQCIRGLVECVSKGGNMLLNVGPDAKGQIPEESLAILADIGKWMKQNGDSIYGCTIADIEKPEWGRFTQRDNKLYAHILDRGIGAIAVDYPRDKIKRARLLSDKSEINIQTPWTSQHYGEATFINFASATLPDDIDTVVEFELMD